MAISLVTVGTPAVSALDGLDVTVNLGTLQQNDLVIAFGGHPFRSGAVAAGPVTSGYTTADSINTTPTVSFWVGYKFMGSTPDTTFVGEGSGNGADVASYAVIVLRGVDTTTPMDAADVAANSIDPASITTVVDNAWVVVCTGSAVNDTSPGTITNFTNTISSTGNDNVDMVVAGCTRVKTPAGAENPGSWSSLTSTNPRSVTLAIRPAGTPVTVSAPTGNAAAAGVLPQVKTAVKVSAPVGNAAAAGPLPQVKAAVKVSAPTALAAALGIVPTVITGDGSVTVFAPTGLAAALGVVPQVKPAVRVSATGNAAAAGVVPQVKTACKVAVPTAQAGAVGVVPTILFVPYIPMSVSDKYLDDIRFLNAWIDKTIQDNQDELLEGNGSLADRLRTLGKRVMILFDLSDFF